MSDAPETIETNVTAAEELDASEHSIVDEPPPTMPLDSAYEIRRQRIFSHRVEAQAEANSIIACLAGVNSDLLDNELIVAETLRQGLAAGGGSLEAIERHGDLINLMLRFAKQIAQFTQLVQRSRKEISAGAPVALKASEENACCAPTPLGGGSLRPADLEPSTRSP